MAKSFAALLLLLAIGNAALFAHAHPELTKPGIEKGAVVNQGGVSPAPPVSYMLRGRYVYARQDRNADYGANGGPSGVSQAVATTSPTPVAAPVPSTSVQSTKKNGEAPSSTAAASSKRNALPRAQGAIDKLIKNNAGQESEDEHLSK